MSAPPPRNAQPSGTRQPKMFCVMLSLLPLLQAAEPPAREPAGFASGWAAIPRSMWLSNYSHAYGAAKTIMVAGPTEDTIVAYNSAQSWSPARGVVNGSFVRMTFGSLEIRGKLLPNGFIVWENGSRWLKERGQLGATARSASPSGPAPNRSRLPPADDESYSYSCAARPAPAVLPTHTHTRFHFRGRRGGVVHVLIRRVDVYRRGRVLLVRVVRILRALAARTTRPLSSSARRT